MSLWGIIRTAYQREIARWHRAARIEALEGALLAGPTVEPEVIRHFFPGVMMQEMRAPAGGCIIGHEHKTEHANILLSGRIRVWIDGEEKELTAPEIVRSSAGTRKAAIALTDVTWLTIHPTKETDPAKLEKQLIRKSKTFLAHQALNSKTLQ